MKKFLLSLIVFLFFSVATSFAQVATPTPTQQPILTQAPIVGNQPIPGSNCGTTTPPSNKCCYYQPVNVTKLQKPIGIIPDVVMDAINSAIEQVIKPIFDPLNQMAQKTVQPCVSGTPSTPGDPGNSSCVCEQPKLTPLTALSNLCKGVSASEQGECNNCLQNGGVYTGVGCVYASVQDFIQKTLLSWGIGLAGIIALLCIIYAAITLQTSGGNPEKIKKAQELLTSCIMGLMLIIFSIFILRLIGVDILRIPGFSK